MSSSKNVATSLRAKRSPFHVGFLMLPQFSINSYANAISVLFAANNMYNDRLYDWSTITLDGESAFSKDRIELKADGGLEHALNFDFFLVCGGEVCGHDDYSNLSEPLRQIAQAGTPLGALSTGTFALASAGLLDGYRCTVHWEYYHCLIERFPQLLLTSSPVVIDRDRYTCAGGVSSLDLMLSLVSSTHGAQLVQNISEHLLYERVRTEDDIQREPLSYFVGTSQPRLTEAISLMEANLEEILTLDEIAAYLQISRRHLERLFFQYVGCSPSKYYVELRLRQARLLLLRSKMPVREIGISCGFVNAPHFSKSYKQYFGRSPRYERRMLSAY